MNLFTHIKMSAYDFFGEDHLLFGADMPYDISNGDGPIRQTIEAIDGMAIPDSRTDPSTEME